MRRCVWVNRYAFGLCTDGLPCEYEHKHHPHDAYRFLSNHDFLHIFKYLLFNDSFMFPLQRYGLILEVYGTFFFQMMGQINVSMYYLFPISTQRVFRRL